MHACQNHEHCAHDALALAENACQQQDARLTPTRRRILELLWESHQPSKAYDILTRLQQEMPSAKPPTVYRALDFLLEHGLIHKIERLNAFVGCHYPQEAGFCTFLICKECHETQEIHQPEVSQLLHQQLKQHAFTAQNITV
ncbi:MAG: transcriptional repressor, partial [Alphaproteobacteria bacterium]|nr:transcriptional repressor [Alphaproteobacteria bacterium]